jgi:AGCS family alanine or glycine:cation symporter
MATAHAESTLAQLCKVTYDAGPYRGGPAFHIGKGLSAPWAGAVFSVCLISSFGLVVNAVQANSIAETMQAAFGVPTIAVGVALVLLSGTVAKLTRDCLAQRAKGEEPVFHAAAYLELGDGIDRRLWSR